MKRKADGPLYLETAVSTLRETSHLTSAPSSGCPTKIAASNTTVFLLLEERARQKVGVDAPLVEKIKYCVTFFLDLE